MIIALAANDELFELLALKGGNALTLVHNIGMRSSVDIDYSLTVEISDEGELSCLIRTALSTHFSSLGITVFDYSFERRPKTQPNNDEAWGGYQAVFKLIHSDKLSALSGDLEAARRAALNITSSGASSRKFKIEISRNEVAGGACEMEIGEGFSALVYTPAMIAAEKLRALCQQMPEYSTKRSPRAGDYHDIHAVVTEAQVDLTNPVNLELVRQVFAAKRVPLELIGLINRDAAFHEQGWDPDSLLSHRPREFGFYVDFLRTLCESLLKALGIINPPS